MPKSEKQREHLERLVRLNTGCKRSKESIEKRRNNGKPWHSKRTIEKMRKVKLGKILSEECKKNIGDSLRGRKQTDLEKLHHSIALKGKKKTIEHRKNLSISHTGKKLSEEHKRNIGLSEKGEKNHFWKGGKSFEEYGKEFNNTLKEKIRKRDDYRCQECFKHQSVLYSKKGVKYKLLIHHIDYNKKNNKEKNLISLCRKCHIKTNFKRKDWAKYFKSKQCK